jgi:hypothetical protein
MATETSTQRAKQEQSIKARKHELFVEDEHDFGPRKEFREYLRETPAAPLSKNVKLMLWGAAAPVVVLLLGALFTMKGSTAKPPPYSLVPTNSKPAPPPTHLARNGNDQPPAEAAPSKEKSPKVAEKAKKPKKKPSNPKPKPEESKSDTAIDKADKPAQDKDKDKDKDKGGPKSDPKDKKANSTSSSQGSQANPKDKPDNQPKAGGPTPSPAPEKKRSRFFKEKKKPVFTYPKREGEKKDDKTDPEKTRPSPGTDGDSSSR